MDIDSRFRLQNDSFPGVPVQNSCSLRTNRRRALRHWRIQKLASPRAAGETADAASRAASPVALRFSSPNMMKKDLGLSMADHAVLKSHLRDADGLPSPEAGLLKLASPELERLIIQSHGAVTTTPTAQLLCPRTGSEEQEFAEGFVKALEDLHKQNQLSGGLDLGPHNPVTLQPDLPVYTNLNSYGGGPLGTTVNYSTDIVPFPPPPAHHLDGATAQDEPQTVPDVQNFGDSPPLSPINMDSQERIKVERKRLRNRIAASKCRKRKLERISRLEDKVQNLKSHNTDLASTAGLLREQVTRLKQKVLSHVNSGCQLLPHQVQVH